jgi:hypothetical protein
MSEKKRQEKDGKDKNKNDQRMRSANADLDREIPQNEHGREGNVKRRHGIGSVREGFVGDQNGT